jgi:RNA polymerase sigma-70 factor (ECF subfamily)
LQELLVLRCKRGERQALGELIGYWEDRLYYYVRRLVATEEDASDVLQQTWIRVIKGIKSLDDPERLPPWLYKIARCTALSHWRTHHRIHDPLEENGDLAAITAPEEDEHFDNAEQVHHGLSRLTLAHREVLTLHFLEDLSLEQMAEVLDIPPGTVKSRLYYAKRALRAVLDREEDHHEQ